MFWVLLGALPNPSTLCNTFYPSYLSMTPSSQSSLLPHFLFTMPLRWSAREKTARAPDHYHFPMKPRSLPHWQTHSSTSFTTTPPNLAPSLSLSSSSATNDRLLRSWIPSCKNKYILCRIASSCVKRIGCTFYTSDFSINLQPISRGFKNGFCPRFIILDCWRSQ